jgi:hypothetical protein
MFMYSNCYVRSVLGILLHCVVLCLVCVDMCTVLLPPGVINPIAVKKYILSFRFVVLKLIDVSCVQGLSNNLRLGLPHVQTELL